MSHSSKIYCHSLLHVLTGRSLGQKLLIGFYFQNLSNHQPKKVKKLTQLVIFQLCQRYSSYVLTADVPNAGRGLPRLPYRHEEWDPDFKEYIENLDKKKPVIVCGDMNVAHLDIGVFHHT